MSSADNFGTVVNAFSTVSMAFNAAQLARALWMRHCPNKARIDELRDIVTEWRKWRARLSPEERVYIEAHRPGFLDQMATELSMYVDVPQEHLFAGSPRSIIVPTRR